MRLRVPQLIQKKQAQQHLGNVGRPALIQDIEGCLWEIVLKIVAGIQVEVAFEECKTAWGTAVMANVLNVPLETKNYFLFPAGTSDASRIQVKSEDMQQQNVAPADPAGLGPRDPITVDEEQPYPSSESSSSAGAPASQKAPDTTEPASEPQVPSETSLAVDSPSTPQPVDVSATVAAVRHSTSPSPNVSASPTETQVTNIDSHASITKGPTLVDSESGSNLDLAPASVSQDNAPISAVVLGAAMNGNEAQTQAAPVPSDAAVPLASQTVAPSPGSTQCHSTSPSPNIPSAPTPRPVMNISISPVPSIPSGAPTQTDVTNIDSSASITEDSTLIARQRRSGPHLAPASDSQDQSPISTASGASINADEAQAQAPSAPSQTPLPLDRESIAPEIIAPSLRAKQRHSTLTSPKKEKEKK